MLVFRSFQFTLFLCVACFLTLQPQSAIAGGNNKHGGGSGGLEILLATGVVAKLLQNRNRGGGFARSSVPIGGRHYHGPEYGAQSVRMIVHHPPAPMIQYHHHPVPQPMMSFPQPAHMYPQQHVTHYAPTEVSQQASTYGNLADFEPKEKTEVIRL